MACQNPPVRQSTPTTIVPRVCSMAHSYAARMPMRGSPRLTLQALKACRESKPSKSPSWYKPAAAETQGDPDLALKAPEIVVSEGVYGLPVITHCCLESHGAVSEWTDQEHLLVHASTQYVSGIPGQMAEEVGIPAA